ncbi:recombinase family protein [Halobacillus ihumii]|uniref:recombinase family protein n=1 Tax=Halobacillus ihumii TaxID=2686092 RepID=UPI0013D16FC1|nr:recombinase family protein [Halobacillus ihumii]
MIEGLHKNSQLAVYVRKSRKDEDDSENTLTKHKQQLSEFLEKEGFQNTQWFEEVSSADSINKRPIFVGLLSMIEAGAFEAVVVVAWDRLTRGSQIDSGRVAETLKDSDTLVLTPTKVYDLNNESDEMMSEFESVIARSEYRAIKRRLQNGKITAVKNGKHVNGRAPFPYKYDRNDKKIKIDNEKKKVYDLILNLYLEKHKGTREIAVTLNRKGYTPPSNKPNAIWRKCQVRNLLRSEFTLGYVQYRKTKRVGNQTLLRDPKEMITTKGEHTPVKTKEQHELILKRMAQQERISPRAKKGTHILSGLLVCGVCGGGLTFRKQKKNPKTAKTDDYYIYVRKCMNPINNGKDFCKANKTCKQEVVLDYVYKSMLRHKEEVLDKQKFEEQQEERESGQELINVQERIVEETKESIERLDDLYIDGHINKSKYEDRKSTLQGKIYEAMKEIERIEKDHDLINRVTKEDRLKKWESVDIEELFSDEMGVKEKNEILKLLIEKIEYKREGDNMEIEITYY